MKVQVLGSGCERCETLYRNAMEAVGRIERAEEKILLEKVTDPEVFLRLGVWLTPALVIEDKVISMAKPLSADHIESELLKHMSGGAP